MLKDEIKLLAFDADDTLWDCQSHFVSVEEAYCRLLADYGTADEISQALFATETADMHISAMEPRPSLFRWSRMPYR